MKFIVDKMPYFPDECPFLDGESCNMLRGYCDHFDIDSKPREEAVECDCLITLEAHIKKTTATTPRTV